MKGIDAAPVAEMVFGSAVAELISGQAIIMHLDGYFVRGNRIRGHRCTLAAANRAVATQGTCNFRACVSKANAPAVAAALVFFHGSTFQNFYRVLQAKYSEIFFHDMCRDVVDARLVFLFPVLSDAVIALVDCPLVEQFTLAFIIVIRHGHPAGGLHHGYG